MRLSARIGLLSLASLLFAGCATPYGPNAVVGGYSEERRDSTHYIVRFDGNGLASKDRVWYFWIYRCAEFTKDRGYEYFTVEALKKNSALPPRGRRALVQPAVFRPGVARGEAWVDPAAYVTTWHASGLVGLVNDVPPKTLVYRAQAILDQLAGYRSSNGSATPPLREVLLKRAAYFLAPEGDVRRAFPELSTPNELPSWGTPPDDGAGAPEDAPADPK